MQNSEAGTFDLAEQPSHDMAPVAAANSGALCSYTFSLKALSENEKTLKLIINIYFLRGSITNLGSLFWNIRKFQTEVGEIDEIFISSISG